MRRLFGLSWIVTAGALMAGCTGSGPTPSVSAVTPAFAFVGRTLDLTIAGDGTAWRGTTTVAFADPQVKVNKITVASETGLRVNVTIGADATVAATDVTVTEGTTREVYKGAFEIKAPLAVTTDLTDGLPQGGFALVHAQMVDITTPFDANTLAATLSATDVSLLGDPQPSGDYGVDFFVLADVLAKAGESVDVVLTSGPSESSIRSLGKSAFSVVARAPITLAPAKIASGTIDTISDSSLYQFTPAAASNRFVQYSVSSVEGGGASGIVVPKSGKVEDALGQFSVRFGLGTTSTDPWYLIVADSGNPISSSPPYSFDFSVTETPCTALAEIRGAHDMVSLAQIVPDLPALVTGDMTNGSVPQDDWYQLSVTGAPKQIHLASGGEALSDVSLEVFNGTTLVSLGMDAGDDAHKDLVVDVSNDGIYNVRVSAGVNADPSYSTYQLFIEVN